MMTMKCDLLGRTNALGKLESTKPQTKEDTAPINMANAKSEQEQEGASKGTGQQK